MFFFLLAKAKWGPSSVGLELNHTPTKQASNLHRALDLPSSMDQEVGFLPH